MNPAGVVLIAALVALLAQTARLARRWSVGAREPVDWVGGLKQLPNAYLHTVHDVVAREAPVARMHAMLAGGVLTALALSYPLHVLGLGQALLPWLVLAALAVALAGTAIEAWRRRPSARPARLSEGAFGWMALAFLLLIIFLAAAAIAVLTDSASPALWTAIALAGALAFAWLVWSAHSGPMRHALAGTAHLVVHPRPQRLRGSRETALKPQDLDAPTLGTGVMADFGWNRLVSFDACVQCGKCEAVCPAFAAGQPLNPKALINDLVRATGPGVGSPYQGNPHPGRAPGDGNSFSDAPLIGDPGKGGMISADTLWACTTCRACVHECPMLIEHVDAVVDIRRHLTLETGDVPERVVATLGELRAADTPGGQALETRLDWAVDLDLPVMADTGEADVLLWIGEGGFTRRNQTTLRALIRLLRTAGVDFAVLGREERDCGDTARRVGDELTFQRLARANIDTLAQYRFKTILTADPHVLQSIGQEYPQFGGHYDVVHHTTYLERLFHGGQLRIREEGTPDVRTITFHDPCYLGRYNGEIAAPRKLLDRLGGGRVEMERFGMQSHCCGGGGGAPLADVPGERRIPDMRMDQARSTNAEVLAVGCPNCMVMLDGVPGDGPEVVDIVELLVNRAEGAE